MSQIRHTSWPDITLQDLFYAYRKAKADCYFERAVYVAEAFVEFENKLADNLEGLAKQLREGRIRELFDAHQGCAVLAPKKLTRRRRDGVTPEHGFFSNPEREFENLAATHDLIPEFRLVGEFPVEMHVLSALWINTVGHLFDALLPPSAYGSRLRRYRSNDPNSEEAIGSYHLEALGSFEPYFTPYKQWQAGGMEAMRHELKLNRSVVALSMDLKSYYHNIDPTFVASPGFQQKLGVELNPWQEGFTEEIARAFDNWGKSAEATAEHLCGGSSKSPNISGGIPIGISAARLIANVLLAEWDRSVTRKLTPVYYGRYVDDILLVLRDSEEFGSSAELMDDLASKLNCLAPRKSGETVRTIDLGEDYQGRTILQLQDDKHKVFFLNGRGGLDFLDSIEGEIRSVSSERRLLPDPDHIDKTSAAKVLSAADTTAVEANSLRRAGGLSVKRLGWSVQLRAVETLARDLVSRDWTKERSRFYEFARHHILGPAQLLDQADYLPRLLALAVSLEDWHEATTLLNAAFGSIRKLRALNQSSGENAAKLNGKPCELNSCLLWESLLERLKKACRESVLRTFRWQHSGLVRLSSDTRKVLEALDLEQGRAAIAARVKSLREHDWGKVPYREHIRYETREYRIRKDGEELIHSVYPMLGDLSEFLEDSVGDGTKEGAARRLLARIRQQETESLLPYLFPTRPYSTEQIALFVPACIVGPRRGGCWKALREIRQSGAWRMGAPGAPRRR